MVPHGSEATRWPGREVAGGLPDAHARRRRDLDDVRGRGRASLHVGSPRRGRLRRGVPGRVPLHAGDPPERLSRPALDDAAVQRLRHRRGDQPPLPLPIGERPDGPLGRLRHADADGPGFGRAHLARRGRPLRRRHRFAGRHGAPLRGDPARRDHNLDDDQLAGRDPARDVPGRCREAGRRVRSGRRDPSERHLEGVHRPEGVHLPARALDAAGGRHH